ncbi:glucose-inactivated glycerol proton symporter STL1 [Sugiyamaella lignohabitans]|uniref:Glucose-inactivated glycerol proton symporter STL1 n=1 Tax=Sugiyamaella lignohabitans TaxID=796027 RepID=A0A167DWW7_9ASCO|nr:glucose-inactivated glycerol proton symporter STL1 [Sugiyamaella lignohabitans]ANB13391.1 glucose-inactivated glycerol proton symporter STL1 [Sugiyamaella lignohabitans]
MVDTKVTSTHDVEYVDDVSIDENIKGNVQEAQVFSAAMEEALRKDKPQPWSKGMIKLYLILAVGYLCSATNGFDANTFGGVLAMPNFNDFFNSHGGSTQGLIASIYVIGNMIGSLPPGPMADAWGRKVPIAVGSFVAVIGIILQAAAQNTSMLIGGRFLLGFGVGFVQSTGPAYCIELAHPAYRGILVGLYQSCFFVGTILTTWLEFGLYYIGDSPVTWRFPLAFQCVPSVIILCFIYWCPDTPRWYMSKGQDEKALEILAKYHADGNRESPIVTFQMAEIRAAIDAEDTGKRWFDIRDFLFTKSGRYRLFLLWAVAWFSQLDLPPTSYYFPIMVKTAGITNVRIQLLLNAIQTPIMFVCAITGSRFAVDSMGRRKLFILASTGMTLSLIVITACSALQEGRPAVGGTGIAFLYVFLVTFSFGWTPLQALYSSEILSTEWRTRGLAIYNLLTNCAGFINTYVPPVAIQNVGYRFYIFYIVWDVVGIITIYFTFVETRGRTLEEIEEIFKDPHPVRFSKQKQTVLINESGDVYMAE